jgi:hypothetical protein
MLRLGREEIPPDRLNACSQATGNKEEEPVEPRRLMS